MYSTSRLSILNTTLQRKETSDSLSVHSMCKLIRDESVKKTNCWGIPRGYDDEIGWQTIALWLRVTGFSIPTPGSDLWGSRADPSWHRLTHSPRGGREAVVSHTLCLTSCHSGAASKTHLNPNNGGNYSHMPHLSQKTGPALPVKYFCRLNA